MSDKRPWGRARGEIIPPFLSTEGGGQREMLSRQQDTRGVIKSMELICVWTRSIIAACR